MHETENLVKTTSQSSDDINEYTYVKNNIIYEESIPIIYLKLTEACSTTELRSSLKDC